MDITPLFGFSDVLVGSIPLPVARKPRQNPGHFLAVGIEDLGNITCEYGLASLAHSLTVPGLLCLVQRYVILTEILPSFSIFSRIAGGKRLTLPL